MTAPQVARLIADYAMESAAPVLANTTVTAIRPDGGGYLVQTDRDTWHAKTVVLASGASVVADVPQRLAQHTPAGITEVTPADYRNPGGLPDGGVLVVGASASGIQIADELHRSGRPVTLAVGEHLRMPRTYRGRDILWWMDASGLLDERYDEVPDLLRTRYLPSMQLVGTPQRATLDLNALRTLGVRLVGRLAGIRDGDGAVLRVAAQRVRPGRPQAGPTAGHHRRVGRPGRDRRQSAPAAVRADRGSRGRSAVARPARAARSRRSSGPPGTGRSCPGCMSRCSTARAGSCMTAVSPQRRACT